jgi:hypothetical protein
LDEGSKGPYVSNLDEAACSEPQSNLGTTEDSVVLEQGGTLELVVQNFWVSNKERDEARMELEALQRTHMRQYFLRIEDQLSWLGWVH